jgi:hypothetical protein
LAAQQEVTEEKTRLKQQEAQREQRIEELKALWNTFNSLLDQGKSVPEATVESIASVQAFKKIAKAIIPGFFKGTKGRLGEDDKPIMSGKDGHLIWADSSEGILTGEKMDRLENVGLLTTDAITESALLGAKLMGNIPSQKMIKNSPTDDRLLNAVNGLRKDINNLEQQELHPMIIDGILKGMEVHKRKGGMTEKTRKYFNG